MTFSQFLKLLRDHLKLLFTVSLTVAIAVFLATLKERPKKYSSYTQIYTGLASGYTLEGEQRAEYLGTENKFDNLINIISSRNTKEETAIRLLAEHLMLEAPKRQTLGEKGFEELHTIIPPELQNELVDPNSLENTIERIQNYKAQNDTNTIYRLLLSEHPFYSIKGMQKAVVTRLGSSDLIRIDFEASDPAVCKNMLEILTDVFTIKYRQLREEQSSSVVAYFQKKTDEAFSRLDEAEDVLMNFRKEKGIVNFESQATNATEEQKKLREDLHKVEADLIANKNVQSTLIKKMGANQKKALNSTHIIELRDALSKTMSKIELLEANPSPSAKKRIAILERKANAIKSEIGTEISSIMGRSSISSKEVSNKDLASQWITNMVSMEQNQAKLEVLEKRKSEQESSFNQMAPLGAQMKRLEREINVSEKEYLSLLASLNEARLKQQNIEMSSRLHVLDKPFFPEETPDVPKVLLMVVGAVGAFILTFAIIVLLELLDTSVKIPHRAETATQLELIGAYPKMNGKLSSSGKNQALENRAVDQITQNILLGAVEIQKPEGQPKLISVISTQDGEGKSTIGTQIADRLRNLNNKVLYLSPKNDFSEGTQDGKEGNKNYIVDKNFTQLRNLDQLSQFVGKDLQEFEYVFVEIPGLLQHQHPIELLQKMDTSLLVLRANRSWAQADKNALSLYERIVKHAPMLVLNGVNTDTLEVTIGELPPTSGLPLKKLNKSKVT